MTRREKELFAAAIRYASFANQAMDFSREGMIAKARKIAEYVTFEVTDAEIAAAVAVNLAGKGPRRTLRGEAARDYIHRTMGQAKDESWDGRETNEEALGRSRRSRP